MVLISVARCAGVLPSLSTACVSAPLQDKEEFRKNEQEKGLLRKRAIQQISALTMYGCRKELIRIGLPMNQLDYIQSKKSEKKIQNVGIPQNFCFFTLIWSVSDLMLPSEIYSQVKSWVISNPSKRMYFTAFGYMKVYKLVKRKSPSSLFGVYDTRIYHACTKLFILTLLSSLHFQPSD